MRAEVEIAATPDELDGMSARIATADAFKRANIEYDSSLASVRMAVERRAGTNAVVRITSDRPFSEPFVDILIELNWQGGRLLREYTFLLDPADIAEQKTPAPAVATVTQPDVGARPAPAVEPSQPRPAAARPAPRRPAAEPRPAPEPRPAAEKPAPAAAGGDYEVKRGDTLSSVANSLKDSEVSTQQMLAALYKANEGAFINGNINRLRAGRILKVPEKAEAQAISNADARQIVLNASNFDSYRKAVASAAAEAPAQQPEGGQASGGKIAPKVAEPAPAAAANQGQLKISQGKGADAAAATRLQGLQEELASRNKALTEANSRLASLEKNVAELQKLVEMKNQNLAELQKQAEAAKQANKKAESTAQQALKDAEEAKKQAAKQADDAKAAAAKEAEAAKAAAAKEAEEAKKAADAAEQARVAAAAKAEEDAKAAAAAAAAAAAVAATPSAPVITEQIASAPAPQPAPQSAPAAPPEEEEGLLSSPLALGGLLIAALGAGYVVLRNRRRIAKNGGLTMSALSEASTSPNSVFGNAGGQTVDTGTSVLHTDFSQSGLSAIDTDEGVDPVAEADVYMAYGRDAQAEEILLDALKNDPTRSAIYVKLLEIYAQRRSVKQFENIATDLYTQTGGAGDDWAKAAALGARLDPTNPLYRAGAPEAPQAAPDSGVPVIEAAVAASAVGAALAATESVADQVEQAAAEEIPAEGVTFGTNNVSQMRATWTVPGEIGQFDGGGDAVPTLPEVQPEAPAPVSDALNLDFNLDLELPEGDEPETRMEPHDTEDASLPPADEVTPEPAVSLTDSMSPLEFDIDLGVDTEPEMPAVPPSPASVVAPDPAPAPVVEPEAHDFDLGIERAMEKTSLAVVDLEKTNFEGSLLDFDFELGDDSRPDDRSLDLSSVNLRTDGNLSATSGFAPAAPVAPSAPAMVEEAADIALAEPVAEAPLAEIDLNDEVSTKLELARAYEEMGDLEGARELLEEVMADGADPQKEMAKTILSRIS